MRTKAAVATVALAVAGAMSLSSPAEAVPSCVAQSIAAEHSVYGPAWGHALIAFLATHPQVLREFGFANLGAFVSYTGHQDPTACPPE